MAHIDDPQTQKANTDYIRTAMNEPYLEKDYELNLARRWRDQEDEKALHELVQAYTRLAISLAMKFKHYGLPMGDLIQEGNIGLMEAAKRFDPERDLRFSTYASWWIRAHVQDYILRNWSIVRTGSTAAQKSLFFNMRRLRNKIEQRNETERLSDKGRAEIAKELGVKITDVEAMEGRMSGSDQSLNATISDDGEQDWQGMLVDDAPTPEEIVTSMKDAQSRSKWLKSALGDLNDREQVIIRKRHLDEKAVTLEALGDQLGISKERVRQIEKRAMEKMKNSIVHHSDRGVMGLL
ncbi:MAG: RNA polymerase factor sigma-32 [Micavibrio sp.]|nr:RNA polymerase factor sigma-32 [Micavibrio sp.]